MLYFEEVDKKYYEKYGEHISFPSHMPSNLTYQDILEEYMRCIEENREFDGEKFFGKLSDDCDI